MGTSKRGFSRVRPSVSFKTREADLNLCLPDHINAMLKRGLTAFGKKARGFDSPDTVLTGVETRTSAPVRILRTKLRQSPDLAGLYPCGEGAGYAGGIMSAAVDGIKTAISVIESIIR